MATMAADHTMTVHASHPPHGDPTTHHTNVSSVERVASALAGGALLAYGAGKRNLPGALLALLGGVLVHRGVSGHCAVYGALGVDTAHDGEGLVHQHGRNAALNASDAAKVERAVTIQMEAADLYRFWRDFTNLPRIMRHLESVTMLDARRSHWKAKAPAGQSVEWDAEIIHEIPDRLIAWRSLEGAAVANAGSVHFDPAPGGRGTVLRVVLEYLPPAGRLGEYAAKLLGEEPDLQVREDLRRFKATMEAGEVPDSRHASGSPTRNALQDALRGTAP